MKKLTVIFLSFLWLFTLHPLLSHETLSSNDLVSSSLINTDWGYGTKENLYNKSIIKAIDKKWGDYYLSMSPILIKATIAIESAFDPKAVSPSGYAGLMQIGKEEASKQGLSLKPKDERFIPEKNIIAALGILKTKHGVIIDPMNLYKNKKWAQNVNKFYQEYGYPDTSQQWIFTLAAYNGGGSTILRAMNYAIQQGKDPREWYNLYNPKKPDSTPLYKAVIEVYGKQYARSKYYQMGEYPIKILTLANSQSSYR